jgi:hypothetical protein
MSFSKIGSLVRGLQLSLDAVGATRGRLILAGALALFLMQNAQVTYYIAQNADSRAIIHALDDDAGNAIDVAGRSRWVTDNGFASYGPVYFRVSSTLGAWFSPLAEPGVLPPGEARTRADHFGLMLTSLVSVALLALLLAGLLADRAWLILVLATLFEWTLLKSSVAQYMILKAHPDQLLGLIVAAATWVTWRTWRAPEDARVRRLAAWGWGVALATKASVIFFTPCVGLAFLFTQTRERVARALRFAGHVALAYFVIGFPQNFNVPRLYRFLKYQAGYSKPATAASVAEWFSLWTEQLMYPLAALLIVMLLRRGFRRPSFKEAICATALGTVPFVLLLPQRVLPPHDHYPIPIIAAQLTLIAILFTGARAAWTPRLRALTAGVILALLYAVGLTPAGFDRILAKELENRPEARAVFHTVREKVDRGQRLYLDPYVPASNKMSGVTTNWRTNADFIARGDFDALVLNRPYFARYYDQNKDDYVEVYNADAKATREFYLMFKDRPQRIDDPRLGAWRLESASGPWEIWARVRGGTR